MFGSTSSTQSTPAEETKPRKKPSVSKPTSAPIGKKSGGGRGNIFGFGGTSFESPGGAGAGGGFKTAGKSGTMVVKPGWKPKDNSCAGTALNSLPDSHPSGQVDNGSTHAESSSPFHGAGFTLSGVNQSSSGSVQSLSAREMARLRWANTNTFSSSTSSSKKSSSKMNSNSSKLTKSSTAITNSNLNTTDPVGSVNTQLHSVAGVNSKPITVACPVCGVKAPEETMNSHLDRCLISQENPKNVNELEDQFDDDDDIFLSAVESSVISIPESDEDGDKPLIALEDSDDDVPLIKKRIVEDNTSLEQVRQLLK